MNWLRNIRIGRRLAVAFGSIVAMLVAVSVMAFLELEQVSKQLWIIVDVNGRLTENYSDAYQLVLRNTGALRSLMLSADPEQRSKAVERMAGYRNKVDEHIAELDRIYAGVAGTPADADAAEHQAFTEFKRDYAALVPVMLKVEQISVSGSGQEAFQVWEREEATYRAWQKNAEVLLDMQAEQNHKASAKAKSGIHAAVVALVACALVAVLLAIVFGWLVTRSIVVPLATAVAGANAIAAGDLSVRVEAHSRDEAGQLLSAMARMQQALTSVVGELKSVVGAAARGDFSQRVDTAGMQGFQLDMGRDINTLTQTSEEGLKDLSRVLGALSQGDLTQRLTRSYEGMFAQLKDDTNRTIDQLGEIVEGIKESADTINVASKEIASGNADLSQRTEEQASSLEETSASMEELTSAVAQNTENARQANQLAIGASEIAGRGGVVVREVVATMDGIAGASKKIEDIIAVIDGIAFQTNILALNAAVEAARAGEQGKGFAVVASEVRNLAQRSAAAAKEIKGLIEDSVGKVGTGSRLVADAGKTMDEVVAAVKRVTDIMAEISAASQEQSSGIGQVSTAVTQMDQVTQQNAALVEESAAAAESLDQQAQTLARAVARFRMNAPSAAADRGRNVQLLRTA